MVLALGGIDMTCDCQKINPGKVIYLNSEGNCPKCGWHWMDIGKFVFINEEVDKGYEYLEQRLKVGL